MSESLLIFKHERVLKTHASEKLFSFPDLMNNLLKQYLRNFKRDNILNYPVKYSDMQCASTFHICDLRF